MSEVRWSAQWMRGVLELCVLSLVGEWETYGYELAQQLEAAGFGRIRGGTLYPILLRLEQDGLVRSSWREGQGGPGRKFFAITDAGREELRRRREDWAAFTAATDDLLGGVTRKST